MIVYESTFNDLIDLILLQVKAVKTGTVYWATLTALSYFYMVSAWGGYVFIINLIPLHVFFLLLMGRFSNRIYIGKSIFNENVRINSLSTFP